MANTHPKHRKFIIYSVSDITDPNQVLFKLYGKAAFPPLYRPIVWATPEKS